MRQHLLVDLLPLQYRTINGAGPKNSPKTPHMTAHCVAPRTTLPLLSLTLHAPHCVLPVIPPRSPENVSLAANAPWLDQNVHRGSYPNILYVVVSAIPSLLPRVG